VARAVGLECEFDSLLGESRGPLEMAASGSLRAALHGWSVALATQLCAQELGALVEVSRVC
jgi:hypothetical protein